jgi:hypothetical protein
VVSNLHHSTFKQPHQSEQNDQLPLQMTAQRDGMIVQFRAMPKGPETVCKNEAGDGAGEIRLPSA